VRRLVGVSVAVVVLFGGAVGEARPPERCAKVRRGTSAEFAAAGAYGVGVRTFTFVDTSRPTPPNRTYPGAPERTLPTEVWYPASAPGGRDASLDPAGAPYPLVVMSHEFSGFRTSEEYLGRHLASRGYVVAAPDFPLSNIGAPGGPTLADVENQPGDVGVVIDGVLGALAGAVDGERVAAGGVSLGGLTTLLATYHRHLRDPRIRAAFAMAPPLGCFFTPKLFGRLHVPLLVMHGTSDDLAPYRQSARRLLRIAPMPRMLVTLENGSHAGFTGFATFADQSLHFDRIACAAVAGNPDFAGEPVPPPGLGGRADGIDARRTCPRPCARPFRDPALGAARHHELTRIAAAAFFDGRLRDDAGARCFLRTRFAAENAEVRVTGR
jgi:dienelactone hydrolase